MFENELAKLDAAGTLAAAEDNEHALITAETRRLHIAAHWADIHPGDAVPESRLPGSERPVQLGGDGTPTVAGFCPAELGCALRMSDGSASRLIADALDLRHRLRSIWATALAGQVPAHQARHIAAATRHLTAAQAGWVDTQLAPSVGKLSWGRLHTLLEATIIEADPLGAEQQAALAAQERFVRLGRSSDHGLKMIIARATAGDAIWFKATIDRIADILAWQGDNDPVDVRRSKAIGILAQPAQALQLLCQHQDDDWDGPAEPSDPAEEPACEETEVSFDEAAHRSLQISPPPFHPDWARPRAVVYVHLSEEALSGGLGVARVEDVGPVLLNRLTPYSAITAPSTSNRSSTCPPATHRWTATKSPPGSANNSNSAARHLAMAITPPPHLPRQRQRHPTPRRHRVCTSALARRGTSAAESASST